MSHAVVLPKLVVAVLCSVIVTPAWQRAGAQEYIETKGYQEVLAAVSRLETRGATLNAAVRQELTAEGRALVKLEESAKQEINRAETKSKSLADEPKPDTIIGIRDYDARLSAHENYLKDLESRLNAEDPGLQTSYAAFAQRVSAAFAKSPAAGPMDETYVPIDRIHVPSPEVTAKSYVQLDTQQWSSEFKPLVTATNKALRQVQDEVNTAVVDELKSRALQNLEHVPGYETVKSLHDRLERLNEGYAKPTLNLVQPLFDDLRRAVWELGDPDSDGRFADSQPGNAERRHEAALQSYKKAAWDIFKDDVENAAERENAWLRDRAEEKPRVVPIESKVTHPDESRINRWLRVKK